MAIASLKPDSTLLTHPPKTLPQELAKPNESVFTTLTPQSRTIQLLKYVEGYPWTVNYYGQIINTANTLDHVDPASPNFTQPVYEIKDCILQVSSPLSASYDEATGVTTVTGSALAPYKVTPNVGDFFVAQVDSGQDAVFTINSAQRRTHRKDTIYEVQYSLYLYTSAEPQFVQNVASRVQQTYYFNKDTNFFNRDNLISPMVKNTNDELKLLQRQSKQYYFDRFLKKEAGLILVPGCEYRYYDPYLVEFITKTVEHEYFMSMSGINVFDKFAKQGTIYDAILTRSEGVLYNISKTVGFVSSANLPNKARFGSAFHAGVDFIAYPRVADQSDDVDALRNQAPVDLFDYGWLSTKNQNGFNMKVTTDNNNGAIEPIELLPSLFVDDYYVVSSGFYEHMQGAIVTAPISLLEVLIARFIKGQAVNRRDVLLVLESYRSWGLLQQMYYLPVLWVMTRSLGV